MNILIVLTQWLYLYPIVGPIIITNPTSINVSIDIHNIVLTCEAIGVPIPAITWTHNGTVLNLDGGSGDFKNDVSVATSTSLGTIKSDLTVFSALPNNTGYYACNATSPVSFYQSVMSTIALVLVHGKASVYIYMCIIIFSTNMIIFDQKLIYIYYDLRM